MSFFVLLSCHPCYDDKINFNWLMNRQIKVRSISLLRRAIIEKVNKIQIVI